MSERKPEAKVKFPKSWWGVKHTKKTCIGGAFSGTPQLAQRFYILLF